MPGNIQFDGVMSIAVGIVAIVLAFIDKQFDMVYIKRLSTNKLGRAFERWLGKLVCISVGFGFIVFGILILAE
jgi:uncharacterized membrane protein